jgi:hypothetical protein
MPVRQLKCLLFAWSEHWNADLLFTSFVPENISQAHEVVTWEHPNQLVVRVTNKIRRDVSVQCELGPSTFFPMICDFLRTWCISTNLDNQDEFGGQV